MLLLTLALSAVSVAAVPPRSTASSTECPRTTAHIAVDPNAKPQLRKLNELPSANMYSAVFRRVNGCEKPIVVRYDVGRR